jgi:hypothetical protein
MGVSALRFYQQDLEVGFSPSSFFLLWQIS